MQLQHVTWAALAAVIVTGCSSSEAADAKCAAPEHRQFDFWLGSWRVTQAGRIVGSNRIRPILGGCAIEEQWRSAKGNEGMSLSFYDAARGRWHQTWIDADGEPLYLEGTLTPAGLEMSGERPGKDGPMRQRVTWTALTGGKVRQHWEQSTDGTTWQTVFDGEYAADTAEGYR